MENRRLLLLGGGGHCKSVLDCALEMGVYAEIGIVDKDKDESLIMGVAKVGTDEDLLKLFKGGWSDAFISVGSVGNPGVRRKLYEKVKKIGFFLPVIADNSAVVSRFAALEEGVFVGKNAIINAGSKIGACSIINSGAIVEHDCTLGSFVHISPGAVVCGVCSVGDNSHIGANSVVRQQINVGENVIIGMGSVVTGDVPHNAKAYGNPCRVVEK